MLDWLKNRFANRSPADPARAEARAAHEAGHWERAAALLRPIAAQHPDDAEALFRLGDALYQLDRLDEALGPLERAAQIEAGVAEHQYKLANVFKDLGREDDALEHYRRALLLEPAHARALTNSGTILESRGTADEALRRYSQAIAADPALLPPRRNLAALLLRMGRHPDAAQAYRALLAVNSGSAEDWFNLGNACHELDQHDEAARCYRRALERDPGSAPALWRLAVSLRLSGQLDDAEAAARRAVELAPGDVRMHASLGDILLAQGRLNKAIATYEHALDLHPDLPEVLNNLALAYQFKGALDQAERIYTRAIELAPETMTARINLAGILNGLGRWEEAVAAIRKALELEPKNPEAVRQFLALQLYAPVGAREFGESQLEFGRRFGSGAGAIPAWKGRDGHGRRIRIGYVSSDFRRHPVGHNLEPIIRRHDRDAFEIYLYSNVKRPDALTQWFSDQATVWQSISNMPDADAADAIRRDGVDILVLLAGRFDDNRPLLALQRAAPIQVSMHDPATSGLAEVDYLIADRNLVPRRALEPFTERVLCLPTFYLHPPVPDADPVSEPPLARNGWVTFGSFNNPAKINAAVVALWARVLGSVPDSRMLLKYKNTFAIPSLQSRLVSQFQSHGIGKERLMFSEPRVDERNSHLARYARMDIALDTFPFSGSTTTFESLWMGVPVVALEGDRMVSRWSSAMLRKAGLGGCVARTETGFVGIARELASNPGELARLRAGMRDRVARSPLCAESARARQLERLYRRMWTIWLNQRS
jgi:predicted O-linked N-acetylglucosamine transferase (SPINDLY family)